MASNQNQESSVAVFDRATIYITKKTVQFGNGVYQFRNVTGIGYRKLDPKIIPWQWIIGLFILGLIVYSFNQQVQGSLMVLLAGGGIWYNLTRPTEHGLAIILNSGHTNLFITKDIRALNLVIKTLYEFMESDQDMGSYAINIVQGNITGNFVGGDVIRSNLNFQ